MQPKQQEYRTRINQYIRVPRVKLIGADGAFLGEMATYEALNLAREAGLDLVEINSKTFPPTCRIADFGRMKYEQKKQQAEAKKKQFVQQLKELFFHPTTEKHDIDRQIKQAREFLLEGHRVKMTVKMRGREAVFPGIAEDKLNYILDNLTELIVERPNPMLDGRNMSIMLSPNKNHK